MNVYTTLLCFASSKKDCLLLTDLTQQPPSWLVRDEQKETLDIVRDGLYNISGISKEWYPQINQAGTFEFWNIDHKDIYIIYSVYFPSQFDLSSICHGWSSLKDVEENSKLYDVIRYLYGKRNYV